MPAHAEPATGAGRLTSAPSICTTGASPARSAPASPYHTPDSKGIRCVADNPSMKETDLLAVHHRQPLAARWFSLASYCLENGCNIVTYDAESFRAEVSDAKQAAPVEGFFEARMQADGRARWTWAWSEDHAPAKAALHEEAGLSESWTQVLADWRERAFQG